MKFVMGKYFNVRSESDSPLCSVNMLDPCCLPSFDTLSLCLDDLTVRDPGFRPRSLACWAPIVRGITPSPSPATDQPVVGCAQLRTFYALDLLIITYFCTLNIGS